MGKIRWTKSWSHGAQNVLIVPIHDACQKLQKRCMLEIIEKSVAHVVDSYLGMFTEFNNWISNALSTDEATSSVRVGRVVIRLIWCMLNADRTISHYVYASLKFLRHFIRYLFRLCVRSIRRFHWVATGSFKVTSYVFIHTPHTFCLVIHCPTWHGKVINAAAQKTYLRA